MMYLVVLIWLLSTIICIYLTKKRQVYPESIIRFLRFYTIDMTTLLCTGLSNTRIDRG